MTDHSLPENLHTVAGGDALADGQKDSDLTIGSVKLEEGRALSHILNTETSHDWKPNEKEIIGLASDEASSDSLNVRREIDHLEGHVKKQRIEIAEPHFEIEGQASTAPFSGECDLAQQQEIGCLGVHELNYLRSHSCRDSPFGPSKNLALKTKGTQLVEEVTDGRIEKAERRVKRDRGTCEDKGMLSKRRAGGCPAMDLIERRVHCTIDDQTARAVHSILNREYTEESTGARTIRQSGGKDRHSKVFTSKGPRDRRVRLSVSTAIQFYDVQDRLGYDQPSKAVDWLIKKAKLAIDELGSLPTIGLQGFGATEHDHAPPTSSFQEPISGLSACSFCTGTIGCDSNEGSITNALKLARSTVAIDFSGDSERKGKDSPARMGKQHLGGAKPSAEEPPIHSASGSNLILNEMQQDTDCASPPVTAKLDSDTHHEFPGLDANLKTLELASPFKLEASNSPQLSSKHAKTSVSSPHRRNLPFSEQDLLVFGDHSMNDRERVCSRQLEADGRKFRDREPLNFSSSELSNSLRAHDRFSYVTDDSLPSSGVEVSQLLFQDQPQVNFPFSTVVNFSKLADRVSDQSQQLSSLPSFPFSRSSLRLPNPNLPSATSSYATVQSNSFSAAALQTTREDIESCRPFHLQSLIMLSPHQIAGTGSVGEAINPGHFIGPSFTPTTVHKENEEIYPLMENVSVLEDELLSSSEITLAAHHLFRNVSLGSPSPSVPPTSFNHPRTTQAAYATASINMPFDHSLVSARPSVSECARGLKESQDNNQSCTGIQVLHKNGHN